MVSRAWVRNFIPQFLWTSPKSYWLGKAKFKAKVTKIVPPWMVMAAHGWWFPEKKDDPLFHTFESNINMLIPMGAHGDDGLGTPVKHLMCRIRKPFPDEDKNE